mmetsp:Transcript_33034/g.113666  ORF Transcript_33034/g.113666 Transcript_33034/m.113666 type:complete len:577 (-) Transcript_33034:31-1761(-)
MRGLESVALLAAACVWCEALVSHRRTVRGAAVVRRVGGPKGFDPDAWAFADDDDDDFGADDWRGGEDELSEAYEAWDEPFAKPRTPGVPALIVGFQSAARRRNRTELSMENSLAELRELVESAELVVVGEVALPRRDMLDLDGSADVQALKARIEQHVADTCDTRFVVVFDDELTPQQQRKLEWALQLASHEDLFPRDRRPNKKKIAMERQNGVAAFVETLRPGGSAAHRDVEVKVMDRTAVVLDLFARRAATKEGRLQVALALTMYQMPRGSKLFARVVDSRDAQAGVGESQFGSTRTERRKTMLVDQRVLRQRVNTLRRKIEVLSTRRDLIRKRRKRNGAPCVALVGYTNAGKSSVLEALLAGGGTGAQRVYCDARPFATLDPLTRRVDLRADQAGQSGAVALVTDTVGFVSKLPTQLVAAFRATLEELVDADLLVHVVDASADTDVMRARGAIVEAELARLGLADTPRIIFYNKVDAVAEGPVADRLAQLSAARSDVVVGSCRGDVGLDALRGAITAELDALLAHGVISLVPGRSYSRPLHPDAPLPIVSVNVPQRGAQGLNLLVSHQENTAE